MALVRLLLDAEADKEKVNDAGFTPLHGACQKGHNAVVKLLIDEGANIMEE